LPIDRPTGINRLGDGTDTDTDTDTRRCFMAMVPREIHGAPSAVAVIMALSTASFVAAATSWDDRAPIADSAHGPVKQREATDVPVDHDASVLEQLRARTGQWM
jgi:hypothetical protein